MPRLTLILATSAVVVVVLISKGARAQELTCPPGYRPDQNNAGCVPSQPSAGAAQGGVAGQAQQFLNSLGAAVQGASSSPAGALSGVLKSFGMGASGAAPNQYNGGTAQAGTGAAAMNDYGGQHTSGKTAAHRACALLTADDVAAVLGESVTWSSAGSGGTNDALACSYSTTNHSDVDLSLAGGGGEFHKLPSELPGMTALSGVGDAAYNGPKSTGGSGGGAQVFVLKGNTYFYITVQSERGDASDARSAVALARKVAARNRPNESKRP